MNKSFMRYKNIFIVTLSILLVFSALVFFYFSTDRGFTANAHYVEGADDIGGASDSSSGSSSSSGSGSAVDNDTSFYMLEGTALSLTDYEMKFAFYVPESYFDEFLLGDHYVTPQHYQNGYHQTYFRLTRFLNVNYFSNSNLNYTYSQLYSIDPSQSVLSSESLLSYTRQSNGMYYVEVVFPFPSEDSFGVEYYYCADIYVYYHDHQRMVQKTGTLVPGFYWVTDPPFFRIVRSSNYFQRSVSSVAAAVLENSSSLYNEGQIRRLQQFAGINVSSSTFPVVLSYKRCTGFNQVEDVSVTYNVNSLYATCSKLVYSSVTNSFGATGISDFNCVFKNVRYFENFFYLTDQKIILQADHYNYSFDSNTNIGTLEIVYKDFLYRDFAIEVRDNDDSDGINLTYYVNSYDTLESNGRISLIFDYETIQQCILNSVGWLCDLNSGVFSVVGINNNPYVTVECFDDYLVVSCDSDKQSKLLGVRIFCNCQVREDFDCDVSLEYVRLDNNLDETVVTDNLTMKYSKYVVFGFAENVYNSYGSRIDSAIHPSVLNGVDYYSFSNVRCSKIDEARYKITVLYDYTTLFKLTNTLNNDIVYQPLTKNSLSYYGVDFDYTIPYGYRISDLSTMDSHSVTIANNEEYFNETRVVVNCSTHDKKIIPLVATFVDTWHVDFMYLDQYNDSCFAVKRIERKDLRIADYGNIRELSLSNVASILNRDSMDVLKSGADETLKVEFNGKSTYTVTLTYSYTTIRMSEASGQYGELKVPLSCYADWCNGIGQNWSILYLNNPENNYFRYSNEVPRENLYGYFASVVFTEQLRDINTWFAQESGDGAVVLSVGKEIRGSDFYKFIRNNTLTFAAAGAFIGGAVGVSGGPVGVVGGSVAGGFLGTGLNLGIAMLCETFDDQNATYYTYFTYLDCKSEQAFLSRSGATDAYDHDNAVKNKAQKVESDLTDFFSGLKTDTDNFVKIAGIVLGAVGALLVLSLIIRILSPVISKTRDRKRDKKNE